MYGIIPTGSARSCLNSPFFSAFTYTDAFQRGLQHVQQLSIEAVIFSRREASSLTLDRYFSNTLLAASISATAANSSISGR